MSSTLEYLESKEKSNDDGLSDGNQFEFLMKKLIYESESNTAVKFNKKIDLVEKSVTENFDKRCRKIEKKHVICTDKIFIGSGFQPCYIVFFKFFIFPGTHRTKCKSCGT